MKKFGKIFSLIIAMIMMLTVGSVFTSCTNDDDDSRVPVQETLFSESLNQDSLSVMTRGVTSVTYPVSNTYKNAYKHIKQPDGSSCSWTSYTLAAAAIARGRNYNYPSGLSNPTPSDYEDKIYHVKYVCDNSMRIDSLESYSIHTDHPVYSGIYAQSWGDSNYDNAAFKLLGERKNNGNDRPILFISSTSSGLGHYLILWDITWGGTTSTSTVVVTDPNSGSTSAFSSFNDRKYTVNMHTLLSSKPSGQNYSFLFFNGKNIWFVEKDISFSIYIYKKIFII